MFHGNINSRCISLTFEVHANSQDLINTLTISLPSDMYTLSYYTAATHSSPNYGCLNFEIS